MTNTVVSGHCRRRKIRCIPSNEPSENKCQNCIRLKKECQFYPVEQNGSNIRKSRSDSRAEPSADEPSISKASASPDQDRPTPSVSDSFDTSYGARTSSSGTWTDTPGIVTSPCKFYPHESAELSTNLFQRDALDPCTPWISRIGLNHRRITSCKASSRNRNHTQQRRQGHTGFRMRTILL